MIPNIKITAARTPTTTKWNSLTSIIDDKRFSTSVTTELTNPSKYNKKSSDRPCNKSGKNPVRQNITVIKNKKIATNMLIIPENTFATHPFFFTQYS